MLIPWIVGFVKHTNIFIHNCIHQEEVPCIFQEKRPSIFPMLHASWKKEHKWAWCKNNSIAIGKNNTTLSHFDNGQLYIALCQCHHCVYVLESERNLWKCASIYSLLAVVNLEGGYSWFLQWNIPNGTHWSMPIVL